MFNPAGAERDQVIPASGRVKDSAEPDIFDIKTDLVGYLPRLGKMSVQLRQTSVQIEESVVGVCQSFQGIAERSQANVDRTASFLGENTSKARGERSFENLIQACSGTMVNIMRATEEAGEISRRAMERIRQMDKATQDISVALRQLENIASGNKILALNARIEAAHSGIHGVGFAAVAVELSSQTERSQDVTARVGALAGDLRALAENTLQDLQHMHDQDHQRIRQCRSEVDDSLQDLQTAHDQMKEVLSAMTDDGALLANEIGSAIRGLQFQDRVAQRIAHVVDDLELMQSRLTDISEGVPAKHAMNDRSFSAYTMQEERIVDGASEVEASAGDVELF